MTQGTERPTHDTPGSQGDSAGPPIGYTTGSTSPTGGITELPPSASPPALLHLLARLAALPVDQRAVIARLLGPTAAEPTNDPAPDDRLPPAHNRTGSD